MDVSREHSDPAAMRIDGRGTALNAMMILQRRAQSRYAEGDASDDAIVRICNGWLISNFMLYIGITPLFYRCFSLLQLF
jgi:hypothetical protein